MIVLGFHGGVTLGQHEPAVAIIRDGKVLALCEEERYLRIKGSYGYLPYYSIKAALKMAKLKFSDIDLVVTPGITYADHAERIRRYLVHSFGSCPKVELVHHQVAHLSAAFYGSGLEEALVISLDASGDRACGIAAHAKKDGGIKIIEEVPTENSLGYFYTMMTYYLGFADGDEYKVMGLAPYGKPSVDLSKLVRPEGTHWKFDWSCIRAEPQLKSPFEPMYADKVQELLGAPPRLPSGEMTDFYRDVAQSTQKVFEDCLLNFVEKALQRAPGCRNLCYAGGIALNCSANRRLFYSGLLDNLYVSPACSDRGLALGCAYHGAVQSGDKPWPIWNAYLGSSYSNDEIKQELESNGIQYEETDDPAAAGAELLNDGRILGWFQGRSEAGARALGNRSILAKCESEEMRDLVNAKIKYREEFRPFAPSTLAEESEKYFRTNGATFPYMSVTLDVVPSMASKIAAVVHVNNTARIQTVRSSDNEIYYDLIRKYAKLSGVPVIMNTSFNLKGQPIIETPRDALMTFFGCGMDALILGNYLVRKTKR